MSTKPTAAASGAIGAAVNVAGSDILPQAGTLNTEGTNLFGLSQSELNQYLGQIEGALSTDPSTRMESIAPEVADITATAQGAKASIINQPRSGAQAYELSQVDQSVNTQIGNALSAAFTNAQKELGQLGEFEQTTGLGEQRAAINAEAAAAGIDTSAGNAYDDLSTAVSQGDQGTISSIEGAASELANLIAGL